MNERGDHQVSMHIRKVKNKCATCGRRRTALIELQSVHGEVKRWACWRPSHIRQVVRIIDYMDDLKWVEGRVISFEHAEAEVEAGFPL